MPGFRDERPAPTPAAPVLNTVKVPSAVESLFRQVEGVVSTYFRQRRDTPGEGTIEIFGERYLLLRAASLSVEFFGVVRDLFGPEREAEADDFARNILFDLSHAIGKSDAKNFHSKMNLRDPVSRMAAGPIHFAYSGWAICRPDGQEGWNPRFQT